MSFTAPSSNNATQFEQFRPRLTLLASLELGPKLRAKVDSDDLVQETFLAASTGEPFRGQSEEELFAWLRAILASRIDKLVAHFFGTAARDLRREHALPSLDSSHAQASGLAADLTTPSQAAQRRENAERVAQALSQLPEDYSKVLIARNIRGQTFPEIAETMNRSVGAITMLWVRAVQAFREVFPDPNV
jgi:RNA polymerase sigma-70 factor, ECF subfamily